MNQSHDRGITAPVKVGYIELAPVSYVALAGRPWGELGTDYAPCTGDESAEV
jgi:hypothetical protein